MDPTSPDPIELDTTVQVDCVLDARAELGECPVWSVPEQVLYWIDIRAPAMHRLDPATGENQSWPLPSRVGSFALRETGGAVVALVDGFYLLDFDTGAVTFLAGPEHVSGTRFNDGKVSPDGRFWAGTMDEEQLSRPIAGLYRLDPDGSLHSMVDGLIVSNGLAWTADGRTMYHSDSKGPIIWAYDYDLQTGGIANRRVVARSTERLGRPDGGAVDEDGFYWSAGISAGVLNKWSPDGQLVRSIPLPCSNPPRPTRAGPGRETAVRRHLLDSRRRAGCADQPFPWLTA